MRKKTTPATPEILSMYSTNVERAIAQARAMHRTSAATEAVLKKGRESRERVRVAAVELLGEQPHLTREAVAERICKDVKLKFKTTENHLKKLGLFNRKKCSDHTVGPG